MIASWCIANEIFLFFEISAKCHRDVADAFQLIVNNALNNKLKRDICEGIDISNRQKTRQFCCGFFSCFSL